MYVDFTLTTPQPASIRLLSQGKYLLTVILGIFIMTIIFCITGISGLLFCNHK